MNILGIIPARGGSKGVPKKNIIDLCGKPLIAYTAEAALTAKSLSKVVLSTDSKEIAKVGKSVGLEVPFLRPAELARDDTPTIDVLKHLLLTLEENGEYYDAICLLQPTAPLRNRVMIDESCEQFINANADTLLSVLPIPFHHHPEWALIQDTDHQLEWASGATEPPARRQLLKPAFHREGSIYISKKTLITEENTLYGKNIISYVVDPAKSVNIDTFKDLEKAQNIINKFGSQ